MRNNFLSAVILSTALSALTGISSIYAQSTTAKDTVSLVAVGDMMLGTVYPSNFLAPNDGKDLLKPFESVLQNADVTFGNMEGTLYDSTGIPKSCSDPSKCYAFRSPERYAKYMADAGFDVMSIANNHSGDFGPRARARTAKVLQEAGIQCSGSLAIPYTIFEKNGLKYGMAAFAPNTGTCSINDIQAAKATVAHLDSICDIVIVSFHGGAEGKSYQHVTRKTETFYGENRGNVYLFAHSMIDAGADIVLGHGPHVLRAMELYKNKFIVYSLGNFCTYGRFSLAPPNNLAPAVKLYTDKQGNFLWGQIYSGVQMGEGGPVTDPGNTSATMFKQLTLTDFPEGTLVISGNGMITKK